MSSTRRDFLGTLGLLGTAGLVGGCSQVTSDKVVAEQKPAARKRPPRPPALEPDLVREFVSVSHSDVEKVRKLLEQESRLVNATWDWGGGDFESGLGAASHVGNRDIALHLLANGARMNIFAAAMLGELAIVKAALTAFPDAINTPGPHGIPLIKHAEFGGEQAAEVLAFLKERS